MKLPGEDVECLMPNVGVRERLLQTHSSSDERRLSPRSCLTYARKFACYQTGEGVYMLRKRCCAAHQIRGALRLEDTARPMLRSALLIEGVRHQESGSLFRNLFLALQAPNLGFQFLYTPWLMSQGFAAWWCRAATFASQLLSSPSFGEAM